MDALMNTSWTTVRSPGFTAETALRDSARAMGLGTVEAVRHMRTSFYAVFDVRTATGRYVARIGAFEPGGEVQADTAGPHGCSSVVPTGQRREFALLADLHDQGAAVLPVLGVDGSTGYEIGWMAFAEDLRPLTGGEWVDVVGDFWTARPTEPLSGMMIATKTLHRLDALADSRYAQENLRPRFLADLDRLHDAATSYGTLHGDLGPTNAMVTTDGPRLFDVETACHGPLVWDYLYLTAQLSLTPEVTSPSDVDGLRAQFSTDEITAAWRLRTSASEVRSLYRHLGND